MPSKTCSTPVSISSFERRYRRHEAWHAHRERVRDLRRQLVLRHRVIWVLEDAREVGRPHDARQIVEGLIRKAGHPPLERAEGLA